MKDKKFIEQIKQTLIDCIDSKNVIDVVIKEDAMIGIAFTHKIKVTYRTWTNHIVIGEWVVNSTGKEQTIELLPLIIEASQSYSKKHASILIERNDTIKAALESAARSRNEQELFSVDYHKWDYIMKDIMKFN